MEPQIVEETNNDQPKKKKSWIKYRLQIGDWIILFLVICQMFYCIYYYFTFLGNDQYRIRLSVLVGLSWVLTLICLIGLVGFRNIWYLLFIGTIFGSLVFVNTPIRNDWNKLDNLFTEISQSKTGFPPFLTKEVSDKGSKYVRWVYRNIDANSFIIYRLDSSDLKCRSFPEDKGWVYIQDSEISNILFGSRKLSELEKELEVVKVKEKSKEQSSK